MDGTRLWHEELEAAETPTDVGRALINEAERLLGITNANFIPSGDAPLVTMDEVVIWGRQLDETDQRRMWERFLALQPLQQREIGPIDAVFGPSTRVLDVCDIRATDSLQRTTIYNEFWVPYSIERQLILALGSRSFPLALSGLCRSITEPPFDKEDRRRAWRLARAAEQSLRSLRTLGPASRGLSDVLQVLETGLPIAAVLFDGQGRLRWLSQEARLRFHVPAAKLAATVLLPRLSGPLELLRQVGLDALDHPAEAVPVGLSLSDILGPGENILIRCWRGKSTNDAGALLAIEPDPGYHHRPQPVEHSHPSKDLMPKREPDTTERALQIPQGTLSPLTAREQDVALLAAQGLTIKEMASQLNLATGTIHTHLKHIYRKLDICSRAELVQRLLMGRSPL